MLTARRSAWMPSIAVMLLCAGMVSGQDYPNKPIRIITGGAGGGSDFAARLVAQGITGPLGQPVIVDNRATLPAIDAAAKAPPDGYTLYVGGGSLWIFPLLNKVTYDVVRDFSPIALLVREVNVVAVNPSVAAKSIKELIALAKAKPGALNYAMNIAGGPAHLGAELFKSLAGVNIVGVAYKSNAAGVTAVIGGEVQLLISDASELMPHVKSGRLRALAVTSAEPSAMAPGLATVAASGLPGYESSGMTEIMAPAKTPGPIINRLNQEIARHLNTAEIKERFFSAGAEVVASSPEQLAAIIKSDIAKWGKLIKDAGIKTN
ncbi:MAG: hypothetical protein A3H27_02280 [Acidobacteria bacterium RIFCSPLOWO2_02_FULL_59_13]|nr:MAG: hypothetical protein A3H27_02280 [Acidobacteria bacterium RIFCSPLOWO2_02_FULL_59_13]